MDHFIWGFFFLAIAASAQPPAPVPAPAGPLNVTKILEKGGQFTIFVRLMKSTRIDLTLNGQLNDSNNAMTIFAPSDSAFSNLKAGTLNSLNEQQKAELVQFHMVPTFLSIAQFQTVSNPLQTEAGTGPRLQLNVSSSGNAVNLTTGLTNTTVSSAIYSDNQLAVYQIDKVLLPRDIFSPAPLALAPAPAPASSKKKVKNDDSSAAVADTTSGSDVVFACFNRFVLLVALACHFLVLIK